jgi:IclR family pca regulon transcriptional regulator
MNEATASISEAKRDTVGSLLRGLQVMEILAANPDGLTLSETAERAGLTRAGARRFLLTLVEAGYATQEGRLFRLSPRLISVARNWIEGSSLWSFAEPFMREVSQSLNESCSAAILSGEDVVYVARVAATRILSVALHVGTRLPAFCTGMGRVLLAGLPPAELELFLQSARLEQRTHRTVTDPFRLSQIIAETKRKGFAIVDEELEIGLRTIAVPVRDLAGRTVAAINVSTQSGRTPIAQLEREFLPLLRTAAARIEDYFVAQ